MNKYAPCIIFLDEIHNVPSETLALFLELLDGFNKNLFSIDMSVPLCHTDISNCKSLDQKVLARLDIV